MRKSLLLFLIPVMLLAGCSKDNDKINKSVDEGPTTYTITLLKPANGKIGFTVEGTARLNAEEGEAVTLAATPGRGCKFVRWIAVNDNLQFKNPSANPMTFNMPAADVEIVAQFENINYSIAVTDVEHGDVEISVNEKTTDAASLDATVYITAIENDIDYKFLRWRVANGDLKIKDPEANPLVFTMPEGDVEIVAEFAVINLFNEIADNEFENFCVEYDTDNNGVLTVSEARAVTYIIVDYGGISSLAGIEHFTELVGLECDNNQLTELDLSKNVALIDLWCSNNQLTELDLSKNISLFHLKCDNNRLTELDISKNTELASLSCNNNRLTELDISKNTKLLSLSCYGNRMATLDASNMSNPGGYILYCGLQTTEGFGILIEGDVLNVTLALRENQKANWNANLKSSYMNVRVELAD